MDGKKVTVYDTVERDHQERSSFRLHARRQMLTVLYPVKETGAKKRDTKSCRYAEEALRGDRPKYEGRNGGIYQNRQDRTAQGRRRWKLFWSWYKAGNIYRKRALCAKFEFSARLFCEISETKPQAQVELSEQNFLVKN